MKILSFDTSAKTSSVAVTEDGDLLALGSITTKLTHSQTLLPLCGGLLQSAALTIADIDLFAVSHGPGSFTGLRIGIGAVKGMAQGAGKNCFGVSTLHALACNYMGHEGLISAVMDARCGQVYNALFRVTGELPTRLTEDRAITIADLQKELETVKEPIYFVGDGAQLCCDALAGSGITVVLAPPLLRLQNAGSVGILTHHLLQAGESALSPDKLMPEYLRLPQAERELQQKQANTIG